MGFYTDMVLRSCEKALAGIILLPLVCLGSFRLCGTAGSSAARGPGAGAGRAGDTIGGGGGGGPGPESLCSRAERIPKIALVII